MGTQYNEQEMRDAGLSPEEIAALNEDIGEEIDEEDEVILSEIAGDEDTGEVAGEVDGEVIPAAKPATEVPATIVVADETGTIAFDDDLPAVNPRFVETGVIADSLKVEHQELLEQFESGEISFGEFYAQDEVIKSSSRQMERSTQLWNAEVQGFLKANPEFSESKSRLLFNALDSEVKRIVSTPEGAALYADNDPQAGIKILYAAKRSIESELGIVRTAPADKKTIPTPKPQAVRPKLNTLSHVPNADQADDTNADRFSYINKLDGLKLEAAVEKLQKTDPSGYKDWLEGR